MTATDGQMVDIPLSTGAKATLEAAHVAINDSADAAAYAKLEAAYVSVFDTPDFLEGRKAEAEGRPPVFHGR